MIARSDAPAMRVTRRVLAFSALALGVAGPVVIGCASNDDSDSRQDGADASAAEAGADALAPDAGDPDATTDAQVDADASSAMTCAEAAWCPENLALGSSFTGIWGASSSDVWIVGSAGAIVHWNGTAWASSDVGTRETFFGVGGTSASDVWVVSNARTLLHRTQATWRNVPLDTNVYAHRGISSVLSRGPGDVWIAGDASRENLWRTTGADGGEAWEGVSWSGRCISSQDYDCPRLEAIIDAGPNALWALGARGRAARGTDLRGPSEAWTLYETQTTSTLRAAWAAAPDDVWAVGDGGVIRHWTNAADRRWEVVASPTTEALAAVWGSSTTDVWAVGDGGTILHYDGAAWTSSPAAFQPTNPAPALFGVWGSGADDVRIVGQRVVLKFTGHRKVGE